MSADRSMKEENAFEEKPSPKSMAPLAWHAFIRPWLKFALCTGLLLISLFQSGTFLAKYLRVPLNTVISMEELTPEDTFWITICPMPGLNIVEVEKLVQAGALPRAAFDLNGITMNLLDSALAANFTFQSFFNAVYRPMWFHLLECQLDYAIDGFPHKADCLFPEDLKDKPLTFDAEGPVTHKTLVGDWETDLILTSKNESAPDIFAVCSTFKPNFSFDVDDFQEFSIAFGMRLPDYYPKPPLDPFYTRYISNGRPQYMVYVTSPYEKPLPYPFFTQKTEVLRRAPTELGRGVRLLPTVEKSVFINQPASPCLDDPATAAEAYQCRTQCFESTFLQDKCRIPGYRKPSTNPNPKWTLPPACQTREDFAQLREIDWKVKAKQAYNKCKTICQWSCTVYEYGLRENTEGSDAFNDRNLARFENYTYRTSVNINPRMKNAKVIRYAFAYDVSSLFGDLGGSWGLFLGWSLVDFLRNGENLLLAAMARFWH